MISARNPHPPGTMIVVVGPSGAGKDTLMDHARERLAADPDIGFVQRCITRQVDAGGENHHSVTPEKFEELRERGSFAVSWGAHGLYYGVPVETLDRIADGQTLVVNGSRAAIADFIATYPSVEVVLITAAPEIIASRLAARGRESQEEIIRRLARTTDGWRDGCECVTIDNSGAVEVAGDALAAAIETIARSTFKPVLDLRSH